MPDPAAAPPPRALRAGLGAAVAVGIAVAAHAAGDGRVDAAGAGWTFLALVGPSWWLARRRRGWAALALTQLAGQQIAHVALSVGGSAGAHLLPADVMLYAHLLGAAVSAWWLVRGERRAWAAVRRWAAVVLHPAPSGPARPHAVAVRVPTPSRTGPRALRHVVVRRGPPLPTG